MISIVEPREFTTLATASPVIDVRSPGEYVQGHVNGAYNIPLYDDQERAVVGTIYVKTGKEQAILRGLDFALEKVHQYLSSVREITPTGRILIYCWRGGMRSASMAEVFSKAGYDVRVLNGGYKAYRRFIRNELSRQRPVMILGGNTGSGKTLILKSLKQLGAQVADLEALAHHKGSVFGALGQLPQPTNEQFENDLFVTWNSMDIIRPIWLEDESRMIGDITLPEPVTEKIGNSPMIRLMVDKSVRIRNLVDEYSKFDKQLLSAAIRKISLRIGGDRVNLALKALEANNFITVAEIALNYYDKAYQFAVGNRKCKIIHDLEVKGYDPETDARMVINKYRSIAENGIDLS